jgi:Sec-independent protein secretion pathway component TatC
MKMLWHGPRLPDAGLVTRWRAWARHRPVPLRNIYAVLIIFVAAAVITPSGDMLTQTLLAGPMIGLYFISIFIAWVFGKKRAPEPAEAATD